MRVKRWRSGATIALACRARWRPRRSVVDHLTQVVTQHFKATAPAHWAAPGATVPPAPCRAPGLAPRPSCRSCAMHAFLQLGVGQRLAVFALQRLGQLATGPATRSSRSWLKRYALHAGGQPPTHQQRHARRRHRAGQWRPQLSSARHRDSTTNCVMRAHPQKHQPTQRHSNRCRGSRPGGRGRQACH